MVTKSRCKKTRATLKRSKAARHCDFLRLLAATKSRDKRKLLAKFAGKDHIPAVSECAMNVLSGKIKLGKRQWKLMKSHADDLRALANSKTSSGKKRKIMAQEGGFLSALIPLAVSTLGGLFGSLFGKKS